MKIDIDKLVNVNNPKVPKFKALVNIRLEDSLIIEDIKLIEAPSGLFIAMPSRKTPTGEYKDICHPLTVEFRNELNKVVVDAFKYGKYDFGKSEGLNITETKIRKIPDSPNGLIAVASIVLNNKFVVHDIKLVRKNSEDGAIHHLVIMPNREINGAFRNLAYAIKDELRSQISNKILDEYKRLS